MKDNDFSRRSRAQPKFQSGNEQFEALCQSDVSIRQVLLALDPSRAYDFKHHMWIGWHARIAEVAGLKRALGGMLFAYDDGVGREWSAPLLDYARKLTPAVEFKDVTTRPVFRFADLPLPVPDPVELMRDALDHIAKTCHQSRQSTRRIRWIEARANGALEGKVYDAKLVELPLEVDREIDRLKRRDRRYVERIKALEALLLQTNELLYAIQGDPASVPSSAIDAMRGEVFTSLKPGAAEVQDDE